MGTVMQSSTDGAHVDHETRPVPEGIDLEGGSEKTDAHTSAFLQLGILDRFLAVWIFLAMAVGIILGNFVPSTGPALQRGKFVGVSIPIGMSYSTAISNPLIVMSSCRFVGHDVSYPVQGSV